MRTVLAGGRVRSKSGQDSAADTCRAGTNGICCSHLPDPAPKDAAVQKPLTAALFWLCLAASTPLPSPAPASPAIPEAVLPYFDAGHRWSLQRRLRELAVIERPLLRVREELAECRGTTCLTPAEAAAAAYGAGLGETARGRFIFEVRSGAGPRNRFLPKDETLFYLGSERLFGDYGVLVLAITPEALDGLMNPPGTAPQGKPSAPSTGRMTRHFMGKTLIVDGEVGLRFIENIDWDTGQRNGHGRYQMWLRVTDPAQVRVLEAE